MNDEMKISRCTEDNVAEVALISAELGKEGLVNILKEEELRDAAGGDGYYVVVARVQVNDEVVGFAVSSYSWGKLHIEEVGVRKDMQGRGIGKKLVRHLKLVLEKEGSRMFVVTGWPMSRCEKKTYRTLGRPRRDDEEKKETA